MPLGAFKLNSIARYLAPAVSQASWQNWTTSNVSSILSLDRNGDATGGRSNDISYLSDDRWVVICGDDVTPFYFNSYNIIERSGYTISETADVGVSTTMTLNVNIAQIAHLPTQNRVITSNGERWDLHQYTSSTFTPDTTGTVITNSAVTNDKSTIVNPDDDTMLMKIGQSGEISVLSYSGGSLSLVANNDVIGNRVSNADDGLAFWTKTGSTYGIAFLYWDTVNTDWRLRHYADDLSSYTDHTFDSTIPGAGAFRSLNQAVTDLNRGAMFIPDAANNEMDTFVVEWNGTSFTKNNCTSWSASNGVYNIIGAGLSGINGYYYVADDVYAIMGNLGDGTFSPPHIHLVHIDGSYNSNYLGSAEFFTGANGDAQRTSIGITPDKNYFVATTISATGHNSRLFYRPT